LLVGHFAALPPLYAAEDLPLPRDVRGLSEPHALAMGSQPIQVQAFTTSLSLEELRAFYLKELPKRGWRVQGVPWMERASERLEDIRKTQEGLAKAKQEHPELAANPELKPKLDELNAAEAKLELLARHFGAATGEAAAPPELPPSPEALPAATQGLPELRTDQLRELAGRQIYAVQGEQHLLLHFNPQHERTRVFVNRWEPGSLGDASSDSQSQGVWPGENPCCTSDAVPNVLRALPASVPQYPTGRLVTTGASPRLNTGGGSASEMYLTADSVEQAAEFYRRQMAYHGWTETAMPGAAADGLAQRLGPQAQQLHATLLAFRSEDAMCAVVIGEHQGHAAVSSIVGAAGGTAPPETTERTLIIVSYLEQAFLARARQYDPRANRGAKP
jgi:hypothetical protein